MRWTGWGVLVVVLVSACTRLNPAFEGGEGGEGDGTASEVTTVGDGEGSETRTSTIGDTTLGTSGPSSAGTESAEGLEGAADTAMCEVDIRPRYGIDSVPSFQDMFRGCPNELETMTIVGVTENEGSQLVGHRCPNCNCAEMQFAISLTFDVPVMPLSGCFDVEVELEPGTCELLAYRIGPPAGGLPLKVVSNVLTPSLDLPLSVELGEPPGGGCDAGCGAPVGHYPLIVSGYEGMPATPSGRPVEIPVTMPPYAVVNDGSSIDVECDEQVRWHATLGGM